MARAALADNEGPGRAGGRGANMGEIICTDLTKVWGAGTPREVVALERVSLTVGHGEFLVVIGPSGCGKSTLLMMLAGLEMPTSGSLTYNGEAVSGPGA